MYKPIIEKFHYNQNYAWFNKIQKRYLCAKVNETFDAESVDLWSEVLYQKKRISIISFQIKWNMSVMIILWNGIWSLCQFCRMEYERGDSLMELNMIVVTVLWNGIWSHWQFYRMEYDRGDSFIEWNMIVVTVFRSTLIRMEPQLVQNCKKNYR